MKSMTGSGEAAPVAYTSRWEERDARRKANAQVAREAAQRRAGKPKASIAEKVNEARERLDKVNTAGAIQVIQTASPTDYDYLLIAEETGQARKGVLRQFGQPRNSVRDAYLEQVAAPPSQEDDATEE